MSNLQEKVNELDEIKWEKNPVHLLTEKVLTRSNMLGIKRETFKSKIIFSTQTNLVLTRIYPTRLPTYSTDG